jgi:putative ABC transport system permease protein
MFKNYLKIALRNMKKNKGYSFINITGLAVGMACCILIFCWINDELSYDQFHNNIDRLYRVIRSERTPDGSINQYASTPSPVGPSLKESYPEITEFSRLYTFSRQRGRVLLKYKNNQFYEDRFYCADPSFFSIFTFPFIQGNPQSALTNPNSVVITQDMAKKYFGNENPVGKTLTIVNSHDLIVSGVIENIPANSHVQFDFICPLQPLLDQFSWMRRWNIPHFYTYILIENSANINEVCQKIRDHLKRYEPEFYNTSLNQYVLQSVKDIHLRSRYKSDLSGESKTQTVYIAFFSLIAAFVLIIACINFINLTTARSTNRAKEIGMRKVSGANRIHIVRQFFGESLLMSFLSLGLAILLVNLSLPTFNQLSGKQVEFVHLFNLDILIAIVGIVIITSVLSGLYPAVVLSSFQPIGVLKGRTSNVMRNKHFRRILVIFQFTLSIILIIGTIVLYSQLRYIQHKELGYDKEYLIYFPGQGNLKKQYHVFKEEMLKYSQVLGVTSSSDLPTKTTHYTMINGWEGSSAEDGMLMNFFSVDEDYIKTFGIEMAEGRFFSETIATDATQGFVLNQEAVRLMSMQNPVGKRFSFFEREGRIIGVMKDFHFKSLHQPIEPLIFWINPAWDQYIFVRVQSGEMAETLQFIEELHQRFNPGYPFDFKFLDEDIDQLYRTEMRTKQVLSLFAGFAIFISCIGLFGLASFITVQRTKEIGIRKVLGASVVGVVKLLSRELIWWIFIANLISWPFAYYITRKWLDSFAYRIDLTFLPFILAGFSALVIALLTVSYQSIKAAMANPVESLRYE